MRAFKVTAGLADGWTVSGLARLLHRSHCLFCRHERRCLEGLQRAARGDGQGKGGGCDVVGNLHGNKGTLPYFFGESTPETTKVRTMRTFTAL